MTDFKVTRDESPAPELRKAIVAPLRTYNADFIGEVAVQPVALFVHDPETEEVIGGLWGQSAAGWLFVDLLFVPDHLRRQGLGTALMREVENIARKRGDIGIWLSTGTFQAPQFYEGLGYSCFGSHPDYPKGHGTFYFLKRLD